MNYKKILSTITGVAGLLIVAVLTWVITPGLTRAQRNFEEVSDILKIENLWIPGVIIIISTIGIKSIKRLLSLNLEGSGNSTGVLLGVSLSLIITGIMVITENFDFLYFFKVLGVVITSIIILLIVPFKNKKVVH
jgi:O-antigen ligase